MLAVFPDRCGGYTQLFGASTSHIKKAPSIHNQPEDFVQSDGVDQKAKINIHTGNPGEQFTCSHLMPNFNFKCNNLSATPPWSFDPGAQPIQLFMEESENDTDNDEEPSLVKPTEPESDSYYEGEEDDTDWEIYSKAFEWKRKREAARALIEFYYAFTRKNITAMENAWLKDETVTCINPGQPPVIGYGAVMNLWKKMFSSVDPSFVKNRIIPAEPVVWVTGTTAVTLCYEQVKLPANAQGVRPPEKKMVALNIFVRRAGKWLLAHHQSNNLVRNTLPQIMTPAGNLPHQKAPPQWVNSDEAMGPDVQSVDDIIEMMNRAIAEGDEDVSLSPLAPNEQVPLRPPPALFSQKQQAGTLHLSPIGWIHMPSSTGFRGTGVTGNVKTKGSTEKAVDQKVQAPKLPSTETPMQQGHQEIVKSDQRLKKTIAALRKISAEGRISDTQKQALLADLIRWSATNTVSPVEVAYELLLEQGPSDSQGFEEAIEDFAEQCRLFSMTSK